MDIIIGEEDIIPTQVLEDVPDIYNHTFWDNELAIELPINSLSPHEADARKDLVATMEGIVGYYQAHSLAQHLEWIKCEKL